MFDKILIANRGEIAVRIARTCRERGVASVAVFSDVDGRSRHVEACDESIHLTGVAPTDTYLRSDVIIEAALRSGAQAIHPGYGFLSESADFAEAVTEAGIVWVGPPPSATRAVGDKIQARRLAARAEVPSVPGTTDPIDDLGTVRSFGTQHGYPLAIKAAGGGGGRGLKVARAEEELEQAFESARREAEAYFGSSEVYVERYLVDPKHLEVQILSPAPGEAMWLGVRDCSMQRRHQKLIEETPPPLFADRMPEMGAAAVRLMDACGYVNAGTVEMLADGNGDFYFLEVNARLQVEHTVTEETLGLDLVACQLQIASGDPLGLTQGAVRERMRGHAIECRINAEDPARGFIPTPGLITRYVEPDGLGVRVDSGYVEGDEVPAAYDSLIAKLITRGNDREEARSRMLRALREYVVDGIATTIPAHIAMLEHESFVSGRHTTRTVEDSDVLASLQTDLSDGEEDENVLMFEGRAVRLWHPSMAASAPAAVHGAVSAEEAAAPMQGTILKILCAPGDSVEAGQPLVVLEAMKMETTISAPHAGTVKEVLAEAGATVGAGQLLVVLE